MSTQMLKRNKVVFDIWPVSFSDWLDAYYAQNEDVAPKNYYTNKKVKKDTREGVMDKLMLRMQLLFDSLAVYKMVRPEFIRLGLSDELDLYIEEDEIYSLLKKWDDGTMEETEILKLLLAVIIEQYLEEEEIQALFKRWNGNIDATMTLVLSDVSELSLEKDEIEELLWKRELNCSEKNNKEILKLFLANVIDDYLNKYDIQRVLKRWSGSANVKARTSTYILPEGTQFFLEEETNRRLFEEWKEEKIESEIGKLQTEYYNREDDCEKLKNKLDEESDEELDEKQDTKRKKTSSEERFCKLEKKYADKIIELKKYPEKGREKLRMLRSLDVTDFCKKPMFESVSQCESDFYCILLDEMFAKRNIIANLEADKWWLIDIEIREQLLRSMEKLMEEEKWSFIAIDFESVARKLLRPHEYILTKKATELLNRVCTLYSIGNSRTLHFEDASDAESEEDTNSLQVEYSDILELGMSKSSKVPAIEKSKGQKILELVEAMNALSQELGDFIEANEVCPDLKLEMEMIHREYCKERKV